MTNPNNATISTVHQAEFTSGHALQIPTLRILQDDGTLYEGATAPELDKATALKMYQTMTFIRVLDERMLGAQRQTGVFLCPVVPSSMADGAGKLKGLPAS